MKKVKTTKATKTTKETKGEKEKTPSFVLELPLKTSSKEKKELLSRFESARQIYNATLGEAIRRVMLIRQSKAFQKAVRLSKLPRTPKNNKERNALFSIAREKYGFDEYLLHQYVVKLRHNIVNKLDVHTVQKIGSRAFHAVEKILYGEARKVRFKGYNQINSLESKSNDAGIRWRNKPTAPTGQLEWNGLCLKPIIDTEDKVVCHGLKHRVKYCRIFRKIIRGRNYFYVQLVLEGKPYIKEENALGKGTVAFDFGPSTIAITSKNDTGVVGAELLLFCSELKPQEKEIRRLQQQIDRCRRQNNPNNYSPEGKIKRGRHEWKKSRRQLQKEKTLVELHRAIAAHRKSLQGKLINKTLRMGNAFKTEDVSAKWLQKLYGKSVGMRAPGMYVSELKRKAESAGGSFMKFPTQTTKLSQTCCCGKQHKKGLSDRVHDCECGIYAQRDLFSSFLSLFVEKVVGVEKKENKEEKYILQADQALKHWSSADKLLQTAWRNAVESTTGGIRPSSFGSPKDLQSQSGSFAKIGIAKSEIRDVVPAVKSGESPEEAAVVSLEPTGIYPQ